nr:FAD-dependent oxidoreductase [Actibacterium sp. 188UL27-1]
MIVIGCGVHGLMVAMVAAEAGYNVIILDKGQPGKATSAGWYGILHGGLRYLQTADLRRFRESVTERRWFAQTFPDHVSKMPFLMPLYGRGLKRPAVFRMAFLADAITSWDRNQGVSEANFIQPGRVLSADGVHQTCVGVPTDGLQGGALWQELVVLDPDGLFQAMVAHATQLGIQIETQAEVVSLIKQGASVAGVSARSDDQAIMHFHAPVVVNAAGPWAPALHAVLNPQRGLTDNWAMAFNLLLNRPCPADVGLSVFPSVGDGDMLFLYPHGKKTFAGTWYFPFDCAADTQAVSDEQIDRFLAAINGSITGINYTRDDIEAVPSGLLPVTEAGTTKLSGSDLVIDHSLSGGPKGLFTQVGVKFTTARNVARRTLRLANLLR